MSVKEKIKIIGSCMLVSLFIALLWPLFDLILSVIQQLIQLHQIKRVTWPPTFQDYLIGYIAAFVILSISFSYHMLKDDDDSTDK